LHEGERGVTTGEFNAFCATLPHATHVVQWGGGQVWKVGGKVFAVMWEGPGKNAGITFKASPLGYEILSRQPGLRPAPYLASRGMTWVQRVSSESMDDAALQQHLRESHRLVLEGLPRRMREALNARPVPTP
jgi:predicted DNA-binding protein (MmcQ/YjbR family)